MTFVCGSHRAFIYERGGTKVVGEVTPVSSVRWNRKRDEVSDAEVTVGTTNCCELLGSLRTVKHELHLFRNGRDVWQGPITRLEYEWDTVRIFAEDMLWVAKRTVITTGYKQAHPNIGNVIERMDWLLRNQCYGKNGDPWKMIPHLRPVRSNDEPSTSRNVAAYQTYVWDDFDAYAEDGGSDYTVVGRDIYYWDLNYRWKIIPPLDESHLSQFPRIVEYGNQAATRVYVSNTEGYAGIAEANQTQIDDIGYVDKLITSLNDADTTAPTSSELASWTKTAQRNLNGRAPPPVGIVIPASTTLLPGSPWEIEDLFPGAWFTVRVTKMCRKVVSEWQRIHDMQVTESAPDGEQVMFSCTNAPGTITDQ